MSCMAGIFSRRQADVLPLETDDWARHSSRWTGRWFLQQLREMIRMRHHVQESSISTSLCHDVLFSRYRGPFSVTCHDLFLFYFLVVPANP